MNPAHRTARFEALMASASAQLAHGRAQDLLQHATTLLADVLSSEVLDEIRTGDLVFFDWLAELAFHLGKEDAARDLVRAVELSCEAANNIEGAAGAGLRIAHSVLLSGDFSGAKAKLEELQPGLADLDGMKGLPPEDARWASWENQLSWTDLEEGPFLFLLGRLYFVHATALANDGQYRAAEACTARARHRLAAFLGPRRTDPVQISLALLAARIAVETGQFNHAGQAVTELKNGPQLPETDHLQLLEIEARLAYYSGRLNTARTAFEKARALALSLGFGATWARASINHAGVLILLNQTSLAEQELIHLSRLPQVKASPQLMAETALLKRQLHDRRAGWRLVTATSASAPQGQLMQSLNASSPRTDEIPPAGATPRQGSLFNQLERVVPTIQALLLKDSGVQSAERETEAIKVAMSSSDSPLIAARLELVSAWLDAARGDTEAARNRLALAAHEFQDMGARVDLRMALDALRDIKSATGETESGTGNGLPDHDAVAVSLADALPAEARAIYMLDKADADEHALRQAVNRLAAAQQAVASSGWLSRRKARRALQSDLFAFFDKLDQRRLFSGPPATPLSAHHFPSGEVTLLYLCFSDMLLLALMGRKGVEFAQLPVSRIYLRDRIGAWHEAVGWLQQAESRQLDTHAAMEDLDGAKAAFQKAEQQMDSLFREIGLASALKLRKRRRVRLIADDVLHGAPFAAARIGRKHLIERCELVHDIQVRPREKTVNSPGSAPALFVGAAGRARVNGKGLASLAGVATEREVFSRQMERARKDVLCLTDGDEPLEKSEVLAEMSRAPIASIACHGVFTAGQVARSGLVLPRGQEEAEILSLADASQQDLSQLDHLTLMACWSADQYLLPGARILSLPETLLRAGTGSVLASFWELRDDVAPLVSERFLKMSRRRGRAAALRKVQVQAIRGRLPGIGPDQSRSDNWACLALYGQTGKLAL